MRATKRKFIAVASATLVAVSGTISLNSASAAITPSFCPRFTGTLTVLSTVILEKPDGLVEQEIADKFMKACPKTKIKFIGVPANDLVTKLTAMAIGGNVPDMYASDAVNTVKMAALNIPLELRAALGQDYIDGFAKENVGEMTIGGKIYSAPWFSIPTAILYRTDLFAKAGVKPPKTFEEFITVCKALTKDTDGDGKIDQYGWAMVGTDNGSGQGRFNTIARNMGAVDVGKNSAGKWVTEIDSPGWKAALKLYKDAVDVGCVPPGQFQTGYPEASVQIGKGQAAMMITGPHTIGVALTANPAAKGKLAGAPIPSVSGVPATTSLNQSGYAIARKSKHRAAAIAYLKFVLNKENQLRINDVTYRIPSRLDAQADPQVNSEMSQGFVKAGEGRVFSNPQISWYNSIAILSSPAYQAAIKGDKSIDQIAKEQAEKARKIIADNG
jgi:ABC-type glycerol-3-phosphate transport system substrate-binding protein